MIYNRPGVQNRKSAKVNRQFHIEVYQPSVSHITAGDQIPVQEDDVSRFQLLDIFTSNRCFEDLFHSVTPLCERIS